MFIKLVLGDGKFGVIIYVSSLAFDPLHFAYSGDVREYMCLFLKCE